MKNLKQIADSLRSMKSKQPLEFYGGLLFLTSLPVLFFLIASSSHHVSGENAWIKPAKFYISTAIYVWTMGWIQMSAPRSNLDAAPWRRQVSWWIVGGMAIENIIITLQAARGVQSHFNQTSALNVALYGIMGIFAVAQIPAALHILRKFLKIEARTTLHLGIQLGLVAFIFGCVQGVYLSQQRGHTVGAPDGGPGLFILNWSVQHGDLRVAHFLLLHGLQILPLLALMLKDHSRGKQILKIVFAVVIILSVGLFAQALLGQSIASTFNFL